MKLSVRAVDFCQEFVYYRCPVSAREDRILGLDLRKFRLAPLSPIGGEGRCGRLCHSGRHCHAHIPAAAALECRLRVCHSLEDIVAPSAIRNIGFCSPSPWLFAELPQNLCLGSDGEGHFASGLAMMGLAYLVSLVCRRAIYNGDGRSFERSPGSHAHGLADLATATVCSHGRARRGSGPFP